MSHATLFPNFISPVSPSGEAETFLCPRLIVSAINPRPLTVYLRMSVFVQYALGNLSNPFHVPAIQSNSLQVVADLKRNSEALKCLTKVLKDLTK